MPHMPWKASLPLRRLSENTSAAYYQSSIALQPRQQPRAFDTTLHDILPRCLVCRRGPNPALHYSEKS